MKLITNQEYYDAFINLIIYKNLYNVKQQNNQYLNKISLPDLIKNFYEYVDIDEKVELKDEWYLESLQDNIDFYDKYINIFPIMTKYYKNRLYYVIFIIKNNPEYIYIGFDKYNDNKYIEKYTNFIPPQHQIINLNQFIIHNMNINKFEHSIDLEIL